MAATTGGIDAVDERAWRNARRGAISLWAAWTIIAIALATDAGLWSLLLTLPAGFGVALGAMWLGERSPHLRRD